MAGKPWVLSCKAAIFAFSLLLVMTMMFASALPFLSALLFSDALFADAGAVTESDIAPTLLAAVRDVLGEGPELPLPADHEFFTACTELDLSGKGVTSLKGIRYFASLTSLALDYNKLTTLKGTVFPDGIATLTLSHNSIADVSQVSWPSALSVLDLRNNRLTNPLDTVFPAGVSTIYIENNFLTVKNINAPRYCAVNYNGNFIFEANAVRPAALVVKDAVSVSFLPGDQRPIPFVSITSSTNPNNQVPPKLLSAQVEGGEYSCVQLIREEYRFLLTAVSPGSDNLTISLALSSFLTTHYERMNQTFFKTSIPITVWQSAESRPGASPGSGGDMVILAALNGRSSNAVLDMSRFEGGKVTLSPGLLAQLAINGQKLILTQDFGNLTLEPKNLKSIAEQAVVSANAAIQIVFAPYELRPVSPLPSKFSDKRISLVPFRDYAFLVQLTVPGSAIRPVELNYPVTATLYLLNQSLSQWDIERLTAFKDYGSSLDLLGGVYNASGISFSYLINGTGRFGIGTRSDPVRWLDVTINSMQVLRWDGSVVMVNPAPMIHRGVTMIPLRSIFEEMGANVNWRESIRTATISHGNKIIYITEGRMIENSGIEPLVIDERLLVPLRYTTTAFGASVLWWSLDGHIRVVF